jgi:Zn finger protein HypA/HybF involved in hydrogenase expression
MKLEFTNAGKANAEIWRLESSLGLEPGNPILHIKRANDRVTELRNLAAGKGISATPTAAKVTTNENVRARTIAAAVAILKQPEQLFSCAKHAEVISADADEDCPRCGRELVTVAKAGKSIVDQFNKIESATMKTAFYRANKAAYDREFSKRNQNQ